MRVEPRHSSTNESGPRCYSDTVGVCLTNDLPSCFSERERLFIVENMVQDFREIFVAMEELMGYKLNIDVSGKLSNII